MKHYLVAITIILFTINSYALTMPRPNKARIAKTSTNIFVGKVIENKDVSPKAWQCNQFHYESRIVIMENIRGDSGKEITLPVCLGSKGANLNIVENGTYIFFLIRRGEGFIRIYPRGGVVPF